MILMESASPPYQENGIIQLLAYPFCPHTILIYMNNYQVDKRKMQVLV